MCLRGSFPAHRGSSPKRTTRHRLFKIQFSDLTLSVLLLVQLSPGAEVVEIQNRVEYQRITARCLAAPKRIHREKHHVTLIERGIDHRRVLGDFVTAVQ